MRQNTSSITIHNLEESLNLMIRKRAENLGISLSKTIKMLLRQALGLDPNGPNDHRRDFMDIVGAWTEEDEKEFLEKTRDLGEVHPGDWE
ncbi:MAG: hypothetical protein GY754_40670 [bacterium]|nr:hypothetical protein [bacterium]